MGHLSELFAVAGMRVTATTRHVGTARFASIDELVKIEVESTPLVDRIGDDTYAAILADARHALAEFETPEGNAEVPIVGHIVTGRP